jgi:hypothetical protein
MLRASSAALIALFCVASMALLCVAFGGAVVCSFDGFDGAIVCCSLFSSPLFFFFPKSPWPVPKIVSSFFPSHFCRICNLAGLSASFSAFTTVSQSEESASRSAQASYFTVAGIWGVSLSGLPYPWGSTIGWLNAVASIQLAGSQPHFSSCCPLTQPTDRLAKHVLAS